ncbi:MAG: aminomethyl-transferring glycine dehydrogenase [Candidatus Latescibacterota bacterium]|nr:aminomethyl-transferring glycine dehydrogenase [Candidatus Latescibacterota bacterium]
MDFADRHIGPRPDDINHMLAVMNKSSVTELIDSVVPDTIRQQGDLDLPAAMSEKEFIQYVTNLATTNQKFRSYIGMGYAECITPTVIQRNIIEDPGWYTQYTPYQAEIAQGRLEALFNFQTVVCELTSMEISNASLLDEATAVAEAMSMFAVCHKDKAAKRFFVDFRCHPQTIAVLRTRAGAKGWVIDVGDAASFNVDESHFGGLVQYPATDGEILDYHAITEALHSVNSKIIYAADPMAMSILTPPGELGADVVVGSMQRFGMPMGYGGPHAAFFATRESFKRYIPGRIIGVSKDNENRPAFRMALQTREQHIRRERATSNICTAQALPAVVASMYAIYHGPKGLREIASSIHSKTRSLVSTLRSFGCEIITSNYFDTFCVKPTEDQNKDLQLRLESAGINLRHFDEKIIGITLDEATEWSELPKLIEAITNEPIRIGELDKIESQLPHYFDRPSNFLNNPVFTSNASETKLLRYMQKLKSRDLSLTHSMIPLGSCTMKLNSTTSMLPISWTSFSNVHPFAPKHQSPGYECVFRELESMICAITGFEGVSLQPNAGSQGEYAGLLVIRKFHESKGDVERNICLIPASAHGTNPASAVMAGYTVVVVQCDSNGDIDRADFSQKVKRYSKNIAAFMITYPSTHGVFEEGIVDLCEIIHDSGGLVYMDGANMNALIGLCRPADLGIDVCHLNLHKTFCIPHGGGGPGMGPIAVNKGLKSFLPGHSEIQIGGEDSVGPVSAAPWGSALILLISWGYIKLMGKDLSRCSEVAILNANYIAHRLNSYFPVLYSGTNGGVAHECILDLRWCKKDVGITVEDVAKRLIDYGFHAPTVSFPVPDTLMIEPTESEDLEEIDRFCEAMISIRKEIELVTNGTSDPVNNVLKNAPHTMRVIANQDWDKPYAREVAAFPASWIEENKFWPYVGRLNNAYGDRNLICSCIDVEQFSEGIE